MTFKTEIPISFDFNDKFIDAVAERVIKKAGLTKEELTKNFIKKGNLVNDEMSFYTVKQIVQMTQKSNLTIRNHIHAGLLKANKIGKSFLIEKEDLKQYLKQQEL